MKSDMDVWIKTFFKPWPALMWLALKVVLLPCSASACEYNWSIEGWIHSNRRNRIGQNPTESLTPSPSMNPSKTLTNFLFNLA
jgi:hypothetical protein